MALEIKINAIIYPLGDTIDFYDVSGLYDANSNLTGYGSPNYDLDDIESAELKIYDIDNNLILTESITYPETATESMKLKSFDWSLADNYYKFILSITTSIETITGTFETVFFTNALNCLEDLWLNAFPNSNCKCPNKNILDAAIEAQNLLYGIKASSVSYELTNLKLILNASSKICALSKKYC